MARDYHRPFGFEQGDPVIVCMNEAHMREVQNAFRMKAYYCLRGSAVTGHRFSHAIVFHQGHISAPEADHYNRWLTELSCHLDVGGKIYYV